MNYEKVAQMTSALNNFSTFFVWIAKYSGEGEAARTGGDIYKAGKRENVADFLKREPLCGREIYITYAGSDEPPCGWYRSRLASVI